MNTQSKTHSKMVGAKKMSLAEFMGDSHESWIDDDFDITSALSSDSGFNNRGLGSNNASRGGYRDGFGSSDRSNWSRNTPVNFGHDNGGMWRSNLRSNSLNQSNINANIAVFERLPPDCTRQLMKELFESRYTKMEKCHVLLDPSDPNKRRKIAFIFLHTPQELQRVLKWNGLNIEGMRFLITSTSYEDFDAVMQFNVENHYNEDAEDERIESMAHQKFPSPQQPPRIQQRNQSINNDRRKSTTEQHLSKPKTNPFGNAKPVDVHLLNENDVKEEPVAIEPKISKPKTNPFGNAKPVDTFTRQIIIEKEIEQHEKEKIHEHHPGSKVRKGKGDEKPKVAANAKSDPEASLDKGSVQVLKKTSKVKSPKDSGVLIKNKEIEVNKEENNDRPAVSPLDTSLNTLPESLASLALSPDTTKTKAKTFDRRVARDVSLKEFTQEIKKHPNFGASQQHPGDMSKKVVRGVSESAADLTDNWRSKREALANNGGSVVENSSRDGLERGALRGRGSSRGRGRGGNRGRGGSIMKGRDISYATSTSPSKECDSADKVPEVDYKSIGVSDKVTDVHQDVKENKVIDTQDDVKEETVTDIPKTEIDDEKSQDKVGFPDTEGHPGDTKTKRVKQKSRRKKNTEKKEKLLGAKAESGLAVAGDDEKKEGKDSKIQDTVVSNKSIPAPVTTSASAKKVVTEKLVHDEDDTQNREFDKDNSEKVDDKDDLSGMVRGKGRGRGRGRGTGRGRGRARGGRGGRGYFKNLTYHRPVGESSTTSTIPEHVPTKRDATEGTSQKTQADSV